MEVGTTIAQFITNLLRKTGLSITPLVGEIVAAVVLFALALIIGWIADLL